MAWGLVKADGSLSAPFDTRPAPGASEEAVLLPTGWPTSIAWDRALRGFVDLVPEAYFTDAKALEPVLLAIVKAEAERRKMLALTPGGAKKTEYADKAAEVRTWHTLGGTLTGVIAVLGIVTGAKMRATFPYAIADAAAFGDTVDKAIARFSVGMTSSATVPAIAAAEAKACAAIKAASTVASKRAAANVTWP